MTRQRHLFLKIFVVVLSVVVTLGATEVLFRFFLHERLSHVSDERSLIYRHDTLLGWRPVPYYDGYFFDATQVNVRNSSIGMRDGERKEVKNDGSLRVAVLGDSFVWGYDVESHERFTDQLENLLRGVEVLNWGVSGYSTDQEFLLFQELQKKFHPDVIIVLFHSDDRYGNQTLSIFDGYRKPRFEATNGGLNLTGVPVPRLARSRWSGSWITRHSYSARVILRAYIKYFEGYPAVLSYDPTEAIIREFIIEANRNNAKSVLLFTSEDAFLEQLCNSAKPRGTCQAAALGPTLAAYPEEVVYLPDWEGHHWTARGHKIVADFIAQTFFREYSSSAVITDE